MMQVESDITVENRPVVEVSGIREVVSLAWPLILNNSIWTLQIFTDRALVAQHDSDEFAATLNAVIIFWAALNLFMHTTSYVATFVAQYTGAGRPERIGPIVGQALFVAVLGGSLFLAIAPFVGVIFRTLDFGSGLSGLESEYVKCLCFGALPSLITAAVSGFFVGRGDSRTVLYISIFTLCVNASLAYCWIFGEFGFPMWGLIGAGWATATTQWVTAGIGLFLLHRPQYRQQFHTHQCWQFDGPLFRRLLRFGVPNGVVPAIECSAFAVLTLVIKSIGKVELAASNMALTLNMIAILPAMGVGQAVEVLVGKYQGENRSDLAENRTFLGLALAGAIMLVMAILYFLIPELLLRPFQSETNASQVAIAKSLMAFVAFYTLFDSANMVISYALRGAGDTRFVMWMITTLPWLTMVLPAVVGYHANLGIYWTWGVISGYVALLAIVFLLRFRHGAWKSMRVIEVAEPTAIGR